ncbi:hypothetical protein Q1695_014353 [Nippostrongylus brasiliensis]|nr:hypothetical protein Q1695_014353 [Nippostrongylus brasiliensis]
MEASTAGDEVDEADVHVHLQDPALEDKFLAAVEIVTSLPVEGPVTTSTDEKLVFYSLFKQATIGPCNVPAPAFWNVVQKFKWDSWKNLGDMSSSTAKAHYIHRLKRKISDVNKEYDTDFKEWMQGELYERLLPKFAIIGLTPTDRVLKKRKRYATENDDTEDTLKVPETIGEEDALSDGSFDNGTSDLEYLDAVEKRHSGTPSRTDSPQAEQRDRSDSLLRKYTTRIEGELMMISQQISTLSAAAEHRHSSLRDMFRRVTQHLLAPGMFSWKTLFILIVWPFIANMLVRMFRNTLGV